MCDSVSREALNRVLEFSSVTFGYERGAPNALHDVSFSVQVGQTTFLIGENGAGKTTLMRLALRDLRPSAGSVRVGSLTHGRVGYCPQLFSLPPHVSLRRYLAYLCWLKGVPRRSVSAEVDRAIEMVDLTGCADKKLGQYSGGMARRAGLAQALLGSPSLLLLDEPTAGLDPANRVEIRATIAAIGNDHTILVSTHLADDIRHTVPDARVLALVAGELTFDGRLSTAHGQAPVVVGPYMSDAEAALLGILSGGAR